MRGRKAGTVRRSYIDLSLSALPYKGHRVFGERSSYPVIDPAFFPPALSFDCVLSSLLEGPDLRFFTTGCFIAWSKEVSLAVDTFGGHLGSLSMFDR